MHHVTTTLQGVPQVIVLDHGLSPRSSES